MKTLIAGIALIIVAMVVGVYAVVGFVQDLTGDPPLATAVPGQKVRFTVEEPVEVTVWNNTRITHEGERYRRPSELPDGFGYRILGEDSTEVPSSSRSQMHMEDRRSSRVGLTVHDLPAAGDYFLEIDPHADTFVLSVQEERLAEAMAGFFLGLLLAILAGGTGLVLGIIGLFRLLSARRPRRAPAPEPSA